MARVDASMKLPADIHLHAPGMRSTVKTVEQALGLIEHELPPEIAQLSRWTFARALLLEAQKTGKSRDLVTAFRQLKQALTNEGWLANK
jgi:hypothetical protein